MLKKYPFYQVETIDNLKELVNYVAEKYGDNSAFTFERNAEIVSISYRQFKSDVAALGTALFDLNVHNTKIAVIGENSYEWILTYVAIVNSGNVVVPLDKELPAAEIKALLDDSNAEALVHSDGFDHVAAYLNENEAGILHYVSMNALPEMIKKGNALIQQGDNRMIDSELDNHALAALLYTSGTTGVAKGVMLSHFNIARNTVAACQYVGIFGNNMLVLPLHHSFGFTAGVSSMLLHGSEIAINSSLKNILSDLEKFKPYNMFLVPLFVETFYKRIWDSAKKQGKDDLLKKLIRISNALLRIGIDLRRVLFKSVLHAFGGNLKLLVSGGAPLDTKYILGLRDFGITVLNGYGITECSPIVSVNRNKYYRDGSIGPVLPCCDVKIFEPDEKGHGEIYVKGDNVMLGYYKNEQATKEAFDDGWFKTGDYGYLDKDGFLFISGRKKNLIVLSNGKNVYPEEVEAALLNHIPYIIETVVYADENTIIAEVFLDTENDPDCASRVDNDVVMLNRMLPPYMHIGKTVVRDTEFPKTTTKKIKRAYNGNESSNGIENNNEQNNEHKSYTLEMLGDSAKDVVINIIAAHADGQIITPDSRLKYDLGLDSLTMVEICVEIEDAFNILIAEGMGGVETVLDIVTLIENGGAIHRDVDYNIGDYPLPKTGQHLRRLKRYMRLSRIAWRFDVTGLENLPADGKYILCPNHQSYLDSLWIWAAIGHKRVDLNKISCLAAEVFLQSKSALAMLGGIPVERSGNTIPAMKRGLACIRDGYTMLIHPEGTRTRDGKMHDFKGGAAKLAIDANIPVIPVRIDGAWDIFPPHKKRPKIFRFGKRYPLKISFGKPIAPDGKSVDELTAQVQSAVERLQK